MRGTIALGALLLAVLAVAGCAVPVTTVPEPPHHTAVEVAVPHGDVVLAGTLTLPGGPGPHPAAVLVTGRGPHDRDETLGPHRPFRLLADTLARAGVAVLRTDDRGVGGSTGSLAGATYDDLVGDTLAAVDLLRSRPDVDPARIGLIGHSEGGWLAPLAAVRGPVAFVVSIAGPAVPGTDVLVEQSRLLPGLPGVGADPARFPAFVAAFAARLRAGDRDGARALAAAAVAAAGPDRPAAQQEAEVVALMDRERFLLHDPAPALRALRVPVLALFGSLDRQVSPAQNEAPMRALLAGDRDATVLTFPGLNHQMQPARTGLPEEYATLPTTLAPEVLDTITRWTTERFG